MALKITCLPPEETKQSAAVTSSPLSRLNFRATASLSSGIPSTLVYLVLPSAMARTAASLTFWGVSKSGSPAESAMTSRPARVISRAFWVIATVADGATRDKASDKNAILLLPGYRPTDKASALPTQPVSSSTRRASAALRTANSGSPSRLR
jgi:hypothetical protein